MCRSLHSPSLDSHFSFLIYVHSFLLHSLLPHLSCLSNASTFPSVWLPFCTPLLYNFLNVFLALRHISSSPPPALVDWTRDLRHDLCGCGARLRAHRDHKQLPYPDKVMDDKIKNAWRWLTRSMISFTARGLYIHTVIARSVIITGWICRQTQKLFVNVQLLL